MPHEYYARIDDQGRWTLYVTEGTYELLSAYENRGGVATGQTITVTKGKELAEVVVEAK